MGKYIVIYYDGNDYGKMIVNANSAAEITNAATDETQLISIIDVSDLIGEDPEYVEEEAILLCGADFE